MNSDLFKDRLKLIIEEHKSRFAFAKKCGLSESLLKKYLDEGSQPGLDKLLAIQSAAGVSLDWLATGQGPMRRDAAHSMTADQGAVWSNIEHVRPATRREGDRYCYIPLYNVSASAGAGAVVDRETVVDFLSFKTEWIRNNLNATPGDLYLIHVEGESMEPTLRPGDVILVDHREAEKLPRDGIYVVRMDDSLLVKRLQRMPGSQIRVTSDNVAYEPFMISLTDRNNEFDIVGRVVWCGRRM